MNGMLRVLAGVAATVVLVGAGGAAFSGFQVEKVINEQLRMAQDKYNEKIAYLGLEKDEDVRLDFSVASFKRGLFSSEAVYRVQVIRKARPDKAVELMFTDTIEHGPWPVSRLKSLEFMPVMAASNIRAMSTLPLQKLFNLFVNNDGPLTLTMSYGYDGLTLYRGELSEFFFEDEEFSLRLSAIPFSGYAGGVLGLNSSTATIPRLELGTKGAYISFTDLLFDAKYKAGTTVLPIGGWSLSLSGVSVRTPDSSFSIRDLTSSAVVSESAGIQSMSNSLNVPHIIVRGEDVGGFELEVSAKRIRAKHLLALADAFDKREISGGYDRQSIEQEINYLLYMLLDGNPSFAVEKFHYKNSAGHTGLSFAVDFKQPAGDLDDPAAFASAIAGFKMEVSTSLAMLESMAQLMSRDGKDYTAIPNMIASNVVASGLGKIEGDNIVSRFSYRSEAGGIISNNGTQLSLKQIAQDNEFLGALIGIPVQSMPQALSPAQKAQAATPRFEDYPSAPFYTGKPAALDISEDMLHYYYHISDIPTFAGDYVDARLSCGTSCRNIIFINKRTGKELGHSFGLEAGPWLTEFRPDSNLIRAIGFWDDSGSNSGYFGEFFYVLQGDQLTLIKKIKIPRPSVGEETDIPLLDFLNGVQDEALESAYKIAKSQLAAVIQERAGVQAQAQPKGETLAEEVPMKKAAHQAARKAAEDKKAQALADLLSDDTQYQQAKADTVGDQVAGSLDDLIIRLVSEQWQRPPSVRNGMSVEVLIEMLPDGTVINVSVTRSSGDAPFDNSAVAAVRNVGRIPEIQQLDGATFNAMFRQRRMIFKPEDLAL